MPRAPALPSEPPPGIPFSVVHYRVPFYDTDAMRIVHHARYVNYLELARLRFLEAHDRPYIEYVKAGRHYAVTRVDVRYLASARFDDALEISCWLDVLRKASLQMGYAVRCGARLLACALTEHALVDEDGRLLAIPAERRAVLATLVAA